MSTRRRWRDHSRQPSRAIPTTRPSSMRMQTAAGVSPLPGDLPPPTVDMYARDAPGTLLATLRHCVAATANTGIASALTGVLGMMKQAGSGTRSLGIRETAQDAPRGRSSVNTPRNAVNAPLSLFLPYPYKLSGSCPRSV